MNKIFLCVEKTKTGDVVEFQHKGNVPHPASFRSRVNVYVIRTVPLVDKTVPLVDKTIIVIFASHCINIILTYVKIFIYTLLMLNGRTLSSFAK